MLMFAPPAPHLPAPRSTHTNTHALRFVSAQVGELSELWEFRQRELQHRSPHPRDSFPSCVDALQQESGDEWTARKNVGTTMTINHPYMTGEGAQGTACAWEATARQGPKRMVSWA